jgi:uncharacterized membrane protein required for colicin V production
MNWTDITVILIIGLSVLQGWRKGLIMTVVNFVKWFIGFVIAKVLYKQVMAMVISQFWNPIPALSEKVQGFLYDSLKLSPENAVPLDAEQVMAMIHKLALPKIYQENLEKIIPTGNMTSTELVTSLADSLSRILFEVLGFLIILLIAVGVITIVGLMINGLSKLPVLNELNRGGGVIVGGLIGLVTVYFIMAMLGYLYPLNIAMSIVNYVESSQFAHYFYRYNVLTYLLKSFFEANGVFIFS